MEKQRVLIAGAHSYIGTSIEQHLLQWPQKYMVNTINLVDSLWKAQSFANFDCILHVAGIAHINTSKLSKFALRDYWRVNAVLPIEVAQKAKAEGVKYFIFLSSMSVYGEQGAMFSPIVINRNTKPKPNDIYGESKLAAEKGLVPLCDSAFGVCILRPPLVYGPGSKGNYAALEKIAEWAPIFPNIQNKRSMVHIRVLCEHVMDAIETKKTGVFFPQDNKYHCTSEDVYEISKQKGRRMRLLSTLNPFVYILSVLPFGIGSKARKAFGSLVYETDD